MEIKKEGGNISTPISNRRPNQLEILETSSEEVVYGESGHKKEIHSQGSFDETPETCRIDRRPNIASANPQKLSFGGEDRNPRVSHYYEQANSEVHPSDLQHFPDGED